MSETTTKSAEDPVDPLYEAASLCGFDRQAGWPEHFEVLHLVLLLAGGGMGRKPDEWKRANAQVNDGIRAGTLKSEDVDQGSEEVACDINTLPEHERYKKAVFPKIDRFGRQCRVYYEKRKKKPKRYITRNACRDWLHTIKKMPPRLVRAWLGDARQADAPIVGAGDTAQPEKRTRAALIADLQPQWNSIVRDLQDAARNGLNKARLSGARGWDKALAIEWAEQKGKLNKPEVATWYNRPVIKAKVAKRSR